MDDAKSNAYLQQQAMLEQQQMQHHKQRIESSEARAIEEYGRKAYDEAVQAFAEIQHTPVSENLRQLILNSPHPAKTMMAMMQDEGLNSLRPRRMGAAVQCNTRRPSSELPATAQRATRQPMARRPG